MSAQLDMSLCFGYLLQPEKDELIEKLADERDYIKMNYLFVMKNTTHKLHSTTNSKTL